jgi:hypothetical protein
MGKSRNNIKQPPDCCMKCNTIKGPFFENGYNMRFCESCARAYNKQVIDDWNSLVQDVIEINAPSAMIEQDKTVKCCFSGAAECLRPAVIASPSGTSAYCREHSTCACPLHNSITEFVLDEYGNWVCPTVIAFRELVASGHDFSKDIPDKPQLPKSVEKPKQKPVVRQETLF